ncbi:hypothetical protein H6P81_010506 [Aristolochia fimbriata]|uniref:Uncharacterized protein n=1 Tax=Aristolochia fimbriata TaxID=158543 RepID=A0AAV7ESC5_ARIFI|nr:hypothetical protein H6P81_010506 [Aristolochia fimbriata]
MAVTHADLEIRRRSRDLGGKAGTAVVVLCVLCGLLGFVFCVLAESSRSTATWEFVSTGKKRTALRCIYSGSGEVALLYGSGGFVTLAVAMLVQHTYIWLAISNKKAKSTSTHRGNFSSSHSFINLFTREASVVFLLAWVCFAVAEVLLLIGIAVESIHLKRWREPRDGCVVVRRWSFLAAGVFDLTTVIFATSFYLLVLRMKRERDEEIAVRNEVIEAADRFSANATALRPPTAASSSAPAPNPNLSEGDASIVVSKLIT